MVSKIQKLYYEIHKILVSHNIEPNLKIIATDYDEFEYERRIEVDFDYFVNEDTALGWIVWEFFNHEVIVGHFSTYLPKVRVVNFLLASKSTQQLEILPADSVLKLMVDDFVSGKFYKTSEIIDTFNKMKTMNILLSKI